MNTRHHVPCAEWAEAIAAANDAFNSANIGARVVAGDFPETSPKGGLLIFLKPEVSQLLRPAVETIVAHLLTSAFEHGIDIAGAAVLSGRHLLRSRFLQRNYRSIHDHAQTSSLIGSSSIPFQSKGGDIGANTSGVDTILGGLVATKRMITADSLQTAWSAERDRIVKLEDDCYALPLSLAGRRHLILNGFYPKQLRTYAEVGSRIIAFACRTDALLPALKRNFQGDADPRICEPGSIRWNLHRNMRKYGIREFNTSTNGIHMSATAADGERELELMIECTTGLHAASSASAASEDRSMQSNARARLGEASSSPADGRHPTRTNNMNHHDQQGMTP